MSHALFESVFVYVRYKLYRCAYAYVFFLSLFLWSLKAACNKTDDDGEW